MSGCFFFFEVGDASAIFLKSGQECNREGRPFNCFVTSPANASTVGPCSIKEFISFISVSSAGLPPFKLFDNILSAFSSQSAVLCTKVIVSGVTLCVIFLCCGMSNELFEVNVIPPVSDASTVDFRFVSSFCVSILCFQFL